MAQSFLNNSESRGLRNNNPGNLIRTDNKWQGKIPFKESKDTKFEQFREIAWGIRAFYKDIINDINKGANTVAKLVSEYAPSFENDTASYITQVASAMGISKDKVLTANKATLIQLAKAKFRVELGAMYSAKITQANYEDAWLLMGSQYGSGELPELEISRSKCEYCGHILTVIALFFFTYFTVVS